MRIAGNGKVRLALACLAALALNACASVEFTRETETSGRFRSTGWAFTLLSWDIPKTALDIARENASDSGFANLQIDDARVAPDFGLFNWILDIISVRRAKVRGTWGFPGESSTASSASR